MRVTTAFSRMLQLPGAWVRDVEIGPEGTIIASTALGPSVPPGSNRSPKRT